MISLRLAHLCILASLVANAAAQTNPFENDIRAFEAADRRKPPAANSILFVGSSTFTRWSDLTAAFPKYNVLNRGFGGSEASDLLYFFDRIITPYRPPLIVYYEGDNDLTSGKTVDRVFGDWTNFVGRVEAALPNTHILYVTVKPSPSRVQILAKMRELNERVLAFTQTDPKLRYADTFTPMLNESGKPRPELFVSDELHLNDTGYALWQSVLSPAIDGWAGAYPITVAKPRIGGLLLDFGAAAAPTGGSSQTAWQWNNVTTTIGSTDSGVLINLHSVDGAPSALSLRIISRFNGANENGTVASTLFPPSATRDSLFGNTESFGGLANVTPSFELRGLVPATRYRLAFYASRTAVTDNRQTRYTAAGESTVSVELNVANNIDETAVLPPMQPDGQGVITISLAPGPENNNSNHFTYLGVLGIEPVDPPGPGFLLDFGSTSSTTSTQQPPPGLAWNQVLEDLGSSAGTALTNLVATNGVKTAISLAILSRFNGVNPNGTTAASVFPPSATSDSLFGNTELFNGLENITPRFALRHLDRSSTYDFTFYASRTGVNDNRETRYTVTGATSSNADLNAANNLDEVATVRGIQPAEDGTIEIALAPGPNNSNPNHFTYLGVLQVGWNSTVNNPEIRLSQLEGKENYVKLQLSGAPGITYEIQSSSDLRSWQREAWVPLTNHTQQVQLPATGPSGFFRAVQ